MHIEQVTFGQQLVQNFHLLGRQNVDGQNWNSLARPMVHTKNLKTQLAKALAKPCLATENFHTKHLIVAKTLQLRNVRKSAFCALMQWMHSTALNTLVKAFLAFGFLLVHLGRVGTSMGKVEIKTDSLL